MTRFTLTIDCDNAAFIETEYSRDEELKRIIRKALVDLDYENEGMCLDINGNRVGEWRISEGEG